MAVIGLKKIILRNYVAGAPGVPANPGQPYIPPHYKTVTQEVYQATPTRYKYVSLADIFAGRF